MFMLRTLTSYSNLKEKKGTLVIMVTVSKLWSQVVVSQVILSLLYVRAASVNYSLRTPSSLLSCYLSERARGEGCREGDYVERAPST